MKKRIHLTEKRRDVLYVLLSLLLPLLVIVLAMVALRTDPFGPHSLAYSDGEWYINDMAFLGRLVKGKENWLLSFKNGLGGNEWSTLAWGQLGLGALLSVFGTLETMPVIFAWVCALNLSICGLTMYLLLREVRGVQLDNLIFSTSYALIGYNTGFIFLYLFFIGVQLLPLMVLGMVRMLRGKSPLVYVLSLAACIFLNFYFGFMLCVASTVLFLAYLYANNVELKGKYPILTLRWFSNSVIAGLLAAPMWMPALKAYTGGGRINQTVLEEYQFSEKKPFLQLFSKLFSGANSTSELIDGMPYIFCGILVVALVILYFMDRNIPLRRKQAAGGTLVFYLLTFYVRAFTLVMHGGTHTNWFPYRYSFVFSFLLICIAAEEFCRLDKLTLKDTRRCGIVLLGLTLLVFNVKYEFVSSGSILLDFGLLLLMWVGVYLYKTRPKDAPRRVLVIFLLLLVCANLYGNFVISVHNIQKVDGWGMDQEEYADNALYFGGMVDAVNSLDDSFFRMENAQPISGTIGADQRLYNYNAVSGSGPQVRMFIHKQLNKLGINWYDMRHWYEEGVPAATDALLGLKYVISDQDLAKEKGYQELAKTDHQNLYQSDIFLPVSILADKDSCGIELGDDAFANLNDVWRKMCGGKQDVFHEIENVTFTLHSDAMPASVTSGELRESVSAAEALAEQQSGEQSSSSTANNEVTQSGEEEEADYSNYIECSFRTQRDGPVYLFNSLVPVTSNGSDDTSSKYLGTYRAGEDVTYKYPIDSSKATGDAMRNFCSGLVFAYADNAALADYAKQLKERDITFNVEHENDLTGTFTAEKNQRILFTIPWDEGWTCYIDGQKVPIDKTWDLFMSVEAPEGQHTYEMKFFPAWMNIGIGISCGALLGLVMLMVLWKRSSKESSNAEQNML